MGRDIEQFSRGPAEAVRKLNRTVQVAKASDNITGSEFITVNKTLSGSRIALLLDRLIDRIPKTRNGGGGGISYVAGTVIEGPLYSIDGVPARNYYTIRLKSSTVADYDKATEYFINNQVILNDYIPTGETEVRVGDNLCYTCIMDSTDLENNPNADPCLDLDPRDNPDWWEQSEEIRVSKIWGAKNLSQLVTDAVPWIAVGEDVLLYLEDNIYYMLLPSLMYTGTEEYASLRFNPSLGIVQAVFR